MPDQGDQSAINKKVSFGSSDFRGGMLQSFSASRLDDDQFPLLINGRNRYADIRPVKRPLDLSYTLPRGNYQALFAADPYLIIFVDGNPFIKDLTLFDVTIPFNQIHSFNALDPYVSRIYMESVPSSYNNLYRKVLNPDNVSFGVALKSTASSTPQAIVCQDGIHQPRLVFGNGGNNRIAQTFAQWSNDENPVYDKREYVPIGKQMLYKDGVLYIISADGKEFYRSVVGRPLDFVVAIDENGNKLTTLPNNQEEASRLSHRVGYDGIVAINKISSAAIDSNLVGGVFVSTENFSWIVVPDYNLTVYGEPTFRNIDLWPNGPMNQFSVVDILGDTAFIDRTGVRSFNAINQLLASGENSIFSKSIDKLFSWSNGKQIEQEDPVALVSSNYAYFGVKTRFGFGILVYDMLLEAFCSLDIYSNVTAAIKQIVEVKVNGRLKIFFITWDNKLYEMYGDTVTESCMLYTKEWSIGNARYEQIPENVKLIFNNVREKGEASVTVFTDQKGTEEKIKEVTKLTEANEDFESIPFNSKENSTSENLTFTIDDPVRGNNAGVFVEFNFDAELNTVQLESKVVPAKVSLKQQAAVYQR